MVENFWKDLANAKEAEQIVLNTFTNLTTEYSFEDVSNDRACWHKGDIKATSADGKEIYIEVKDDSRIAETRNILCEEAVFYSSISDWVNGNMYSDYEIYAVVSKSERKIYVFWFSAIQGIYKREGKFKAIPHREQITHCYLLPISAVESIGGLIKVIDY